MSKQNYRKSTDRHKRVQRVKGVTIITMVMCMMLPILFCFVLFVKVYNLNQKLDHMTTQIANLTRVSIEQQEQLQQWMEDNATVSQGMVSVEQAEPDSMDMGQITEVENLPDEDAEAAQYKHKVYLTFDDGPGKNTDDILAILDKYQVKATFFVVGKEIEDAEEELKDIVAGGHTLGLHSYSHNYREIYQSVDAFSKDFIRLQNYVYDITGVKSTVYRFPGGSSNTVSDLDMQNFADYLESQDVEYYDWNISSGDGGSHLLDVQTIVDNCTKNIQNYGTSVILMHDSAEKTTTVQALPIIIEKILAMEDTVILPITEDTKPVRHLDAKKQ